MKKLFISFLLFIITTGCWNYKELNDYALVTGMAIDYKNNKYEVSLLIANGNKQEENKAQITVSSAKGKTIYEALKNISLSTPKEIYISHLSVIVISEDIARKGLDSILDLLIRETQSHQNFYVVIAKDSLAKDILSILDPLSEYPSQNITSSIKNTEQNQGRITDASFNTFLGKILEKGIEPVANSIILIGDEKEGTSIEKQESSKLRNYTKLDNLAIFKEDKLVAWATEKESIGINLLLNNINTFYLNIPCNEKNLVLISNKYKLKNIIEKDKITINIKSEGFINENACNIDFNNTKEVKKIEKKAENMINEYTNLAIAKAKKYKTDIFGFGNQIYHKYPKYYKEINDWNEIFPKLEIKINVDYKIKNIGASRKSIKSIEE